MQAGWSFLQQQNSAEPPYISLGERGAPLCL